MSRLLRRDFNQPSSESIVQLLQHSKVWNLSLNIHHLMFHVGLKGDGNVEWVHFGEHECRSPCAGPCVRPCVLACVRGHACVRRGALHREKVWNKSPGFPHPSSLSLSSTDDQRVDTSIGREFVATSSLIHFCTSLHYMFFILLVQHHQSMSA